MQALKETISVICSIIAMRQRQRPVDLLQDAAASPSIAASASMRLASALVWRFTFLVSVQPQTHAATTTSKSTPTIQVRF